MSLTHGFARLVLIAGHGASVVNNPHASMLHCGDFSGNVNAGLLAALINDPSVRAGLGKRGIAVPSDRLFPAALHETTTDSVTLYEADHPSADHAANIAQAKQWLTRAGALTRAERALYLPGARTAADISRRARDWAEVRPEWGLTGCQAFIAAPRSRTAGRNLGGRVFLHHYIWRKDQDFRISRTDYDGADDRGKLDQATTRDRDPVDVLNDLETLNHLLRTRSNTRICSSLKEYVDEA